MLQVPLDSRPAVHTPSPQQLVSVTTSDIVHDKEFALQRLSEHASPRLVVEGRKVCLGDVHPRKSSKGKWNHLENRSKYNWVDATELGHSAGVPAAKAISPPSIPPARAVGWAGAAGLPVPGLAHAIAAHGASTGLRGAVGRAGGALAMAAVHEAL